MVTEELTDSEIKAKIMDHLNWNAKIDATRLNPEVNDGTVVIRGEVDSYPARTEVELLATEVEGVRVVENELEVSPPSEEAPPDAEICNRANQILNWDTHIDASDLSLEVGDGVITVKGSVEGTWQELEVLSQLGRLEGVQDVRNEISVVPSKDVNDEMIASELIDSLDRIEGIDTDPLEFMVDDGEVHLGGRVSSARERETVYETARQTPGVTRVLDNMIVK